MVTSSSAFASVCVRERARAWVCESVRAIGGAASGARFVFAGLYK